MNEYAVEVVRRFVEKLDYNEVTLKSDKEPAILALKEAVRRETSVEIVTDDTWVAETAVKAVQGQFRVLKGALESGINRRVEGDHQAVPWMATHTATVIDKGRKDDEGFTAYGRWKGERVHQASGGLGESVMYLPAASVGKNKFDVRWEDGFWLAIRTESGESVIRTAK